MKPVSAIVIYEGENARVEVRIEHDNVWLNLQQVADLFGRDKSVISRHLKNIFDTKELERDSVVAKNATTAADGKTYLVDYYNLDAIISVGYRVNSTRATRFRQWATRVLREHLTKGYTLNRQRFEQNARELEATLALVRKAAAGEVLTTDHGRGPVDMIARYTQTFLLLQHYDEGLLAEPKGAPGPVCSEPAPSQQPVPSANGARSSPPSMTAKRIFFLLTTLVGCLTKSP
ncbi:MAG: virulence RhuM family protein [Nitrospira sp.]|nr:virulence RhuM family protein [Nitrospira sp.]